MFPGQINTDELRDVVQGIFPLSKDDFSIINVKGTTSCFKTSVKCVLKNKSDVDTFIIDYGQHNNETLRKGKTRKLSSKSSYSLVVYYRCQHNTKNPKTADVQTLMKEKPFKRLKNTNCPFSLSVKIHKNFERFPCTLEIEWAHNHPVNALQAWSFKDIADVTAEKIRSLFDDNFTPGMAYREFLKEIKSNCSSELDYHMITADRSKVPRRNDFNNLYTDYVR